MGENEPQKLIGNNSNGKPQFLSSLIFKSLSTELGKVKYLVSLKKLKLYVLLLNDMFQVIYVNSYRINMWRQFYTLIRVDIKPSDKDSVQTWQTVINSNNWQHYENNPSSADEQSSWYIRQKPFLDHYILF